MVIHFRLRLVVMVLQVVIHLEAQEVREILVVIHLEVKGDQ